MDQIDNGGGSNDRTAGVSLALASALSVAVMAHHPSGFDSRVGAPVHAAMILLIIVSLAGYARLAWRCGLQRFSVFVGLVAYAMASMANALAGAINGFVAPALHARAASEGVLRLCWEFNQALAHGAVYGIAVAITLWSVQLIRFGAIERVIAIAGLAIGAVTATLLISRAMAMNVAGAFVIYALQALFGVLAGAVLIRGRASSNETSLAGRSEIA